MMDCMVRLAGHHLFTPWQSRHSRANTQKTSLLGVASPNCATPNHAQPLMRFLQAKRGVSIMPHEGTQRYEAPQRPKELGPMDSLTKSAPN